MMDLGGWSLRNRKLVYFLIAVLLLGGIYSYYNMSKLEDPHIEVRQAMVVAVYPGSTSYETELEVTDVLEKAIRSMNGVRSVQSRSMNDMVMIEVLLRLDIPQNEIDQYWGVLRRKVEDAQSDLPVGVTTKVLDTFGNVYGLFYAITSDNYSEKELGEYAQYVKRDIQSIKGISDVEIYGERKECINISLMSDRMASLGVIPVEVIMTLNSQNSTVYAGNYQSGDSKVKVVVNDRYKSIKDFENLIIQGHEGDQLRLKDIATVTTYIDNSSRNQMFWNSQRAIGISIAADEGTDIVKLGREVEKHVSKLESSYLPAGIELHKIFFQSDRVTDSISTFMLNLLFSVLIVIILLMLTMGFQSGMIIGKVLLISVVGSFLILNFFDGTIQRVSLATFILAMGMLVDNAIVIVDGIMVDMKRGVPRKQALTNIGKKTAFPLLGATLIAILAFLPPFISKEVAGTYVRDLFIVLAVSLMLSWILALVYVPLTANRRLKIKACSDGEQPFDSKYYSALRRVLNWVLHHRFITIMSTVALVLVSVFCFKYLPREFFPDLDYNQMFIEYKLPEGNDADKVKADLDEISTYLKNRKDVKNITMSLGGTPCRYNLVRSIAYPSLSYGELIVDFTNSKALNSAIEEIQTYLVANYPQAFTRAKKYNLMYKKFNIELEFSGPDPAVLRQLTAQATDIMKSDSNTRFVCTDWEPAQPVLIVDYNQPTARALGFTRNDVGLSVLAATSGIPVGSFYDGSYEKTIYLNCVGNTSLENAPVFSTIPPFQNISSSTVKGLMTGVVKKEEVAESLLRTVPLTQAADSVSVEWIDPFVIRDAGQRAMKAQCEPAAGISAETARKSIDQKIKQMIIPDGYSYQWLGEYEASSNSSKSLFGGIPLAIILIITILIMLFKDYKRPIIIILCIPLLAIGIVFGMLVSGKAFGFVAICGCLGLMGMLIKNAVILMDEIDIQLNNGVKPKTAIIESSASRFRPVMMASMTTILGMIPLLRDCLFGSLAVTIMAGLFIGTLITLLFIPILYSLFFKIKID